VFVAGAAPDWFVFPAINIVAWLQKEGVTMVAGLVMLVFSYKLLTILVSRYAHIAVRPLSEEAQRKTELFIAHIFTRFLRVGAFLTAVIFLLPRFGIDPAPVIAGFGVVGLAVGFASQLIVRDLISGVVLLAEGRFKKGEKISAGGGEGVVIDFDLRGVVLRGDDGTEHYVPFGEIRKISRCADGVLPQHENTKTDTGGTNDAL